MSRLFYKESAGKDWNQALPIGNGKLGAMIFGGENCEHLQINEDSLWYGDALHRINQDARPNLEKVRRLLFEGKIPEAESLLLHAFSGTPPCARPYSTLGDLYIQYPGIKGSCTDYSRELNLSTAVHTVKKTAEKVTYIEEIFANALYNVIAIRIRAMEQTPFDLSVNFGRLCFYDRGFHDEENIYGVGKLAGEDYHFAAGFTVISKNGKISYLGEYARCEQVEEVCILFSAATSYRHEDTISYIKETLKKASEVGYDELLASHIRQYQSFFTKTELRLEYDRDLDELPTNERLERIGEDTPDHGLINTYFDYGRYLLISCSQPGSLPANLQGIWNKDMDPAWGCKYTVNINTQMNYWPAEMYGLGDCQEPLFEHMKRMCEKGKRTAREMYGCRGTVCHHNTDLWADTAPQDTWIPGTYWVMSMPWLCTHIWAHYEYTKDIAFLREMYPVVKESVLFFHDFLIETEEEVMISPSVSPENTYILPNGVEGSVCISSTMDLEILRDHFTQYLEMVKILEKDVSCTTEWEKEDPDMIANTERLLKKIPPLKIGSYGQIMEWREDYKEKEPGHRHISHLYALHPSNQITVDKTPELAEAARITLQRRLSYGGGHTGWSRAWIMNMYARLWDAEKTYENLIALFKRSTLPNLFDNHPPFQIDGNFGSIAAIGEMLVQSDADRIVLLPALPACWENGEIKGIMARGGIRLHMSWKDSVLKACTIEALAADYHGKIQYADQIYQINLKKGEHCTLF